MMALCLVLLTSASVLAQSPKYEVRAVWFTTIGSLDWPRTQARDAQSVERQKQEMVKALDRLHRANINTVIFQTRLRATTVYPSQQEPWDVCLTGKAGMNPGYDPLQFAIEECHKRGMELHAWVVTIPVGKWNSPGCKRLRERFPNLIKKIGDEGYMNPEMEQTGRYLAEICSDITRRYDIDGIHLDYIRYPETWKNISNREQGRRNITRIVRSIYDEVKRQKPWVKVSCSPIGKYSDLTRQTSKGWNAYHTVCQDAQQWLREGIMDELFPMMYFRGEHFYPFAVDWHEHSYGRIVAPGLGIWFLDRREGNWPLMDITREMEVLRGMGMGHTFFRSKFFTDNTKGLYDYTYRQFNRYPALVPPMTWQSKLIPLAPDFIDIETGGNTVTLSWQPVRKKDDGNYFTYNIYASEHNPVDISDGANLVATRIRKNSVTFTRRTDRALYYAVTTMDRFGNESAARQSGSATTSSPTLLKNDGRRLYLPPKPQEADANFLVIESMSGVQMMRAYYNDQPVDISRLPDGVYVVRSMNRKKVTHKIGQFIKKSK